MGFLFHTAFPAVLNMSLTAIPVILAVLLARLILKRAPKIFSYALWAVVLFRLLCPVSVTAGFSLLGALDAPVRESTAIVNSVEYVRPSQTAPVTPAAPMETPNPQTPAAPATPTQPEPARRQATPTDALTCIWLVGILLMLGYSTVSLLLLRRRLVGSIHLRDNIYLSDYAETAFVMGVVRPKIYLPSTIQPQEQQYILLHEQQHILRGDPAWKLLGFLALAIHWFNPLVWVSFLLAARDMEMSCDEAVVQKLGSGIRMDYSESLLNLAAGHHLIAAPLAFGEGDTRSRIQNVLNWKRPRTWVVLLATIGCVVVVAACGVNPAQSTPHTTGEYADMDAYIAALSEAKGSTRELHLIDPETEQMAETPTAFPVRKTTCQNLVQLGQQAELSPEGTLTVWKFDLIPQLDLGTHHANEIFTAGGCYVEDDGTAHLDGSHITVTLTHLDGTLDVLHDEEDFEGGMTFLNYHNSWDDALYDWYINEFDLDLPLVVTDWRDQLTIPEGGSLGNYPVHRYDGDGWYLYLPIQAWEEMEGLHNCWTSSYGTGSQLSITHCDGTAQEEADALDTLQDGSYWERISGEIPHVRRTEKEINFCMENYYFDDSRGGCWCVSLNWHPVAIQNHWSPYTKMEPDLLHLMAESFTTDDRFRQTSELWSVKTGDAVELLLHQSEQDVRWRAGLWDNNAAALHFRHLSELTWKKADPIQNFKGATVTLVTKQYNLTAYEGMRTVCKENPGNSVEWLEADSDGNVEPPYEILRSWLDELEYDFLDHEEALFVPDHGQTWQEAVAEFAENYPKQQPKVSPGSKYSCSFVKVTTTPKQNIHVYGADGVVDENSYCFGLTLVFVPENERVLTSAMPSSTTKYTGSDPDVPKGAYEYFRWTTIQKREDGWHVNLRSTNS